MFSLSNRLNMLMNFALVMLMLSWYIRFTSYPSIFDVVMIPSLLKSQDLDIQLLVACYTTIKFQKLSSILQCAIADTSLHKSSFSVFHFPLLPGAFETARLLISYSCPPICFSTF